MDTSTKYKVVFQLTDNDTFIQKSILRQLTNLLEAMEDVDIEVVTHSYGIDLLLTGTPFQDVIHKLERRGVNFLVCENTLRHEKLDRSRLLDSVNTVPAGVAHIVRRQAEGWSYIKAGF
jgi:hypothetical protein